jgi:hypothetical protein
MNTMRAFTLAMALGAVAASIASAALPAASSWTSRGGTRSIYEVHEPFVLRQQGDTVWVTPYPDAAQCPGDPGGGHGGEATGGAGGSETWCFEGGPGDTCGTVSPWDVSCFDHIDVRALASPTGVNYWHIDTYTTEESEFLGDYCLWCGADSVWEGNPVECGTWANPPGYGDSWNCICELDLDSTFSTVWGCTLQFDLRYDTECVYDYFYLDVHNGTGWVTLATFNGSSTNPGSTCGVWSKPTPDYFGNVDTGQPNSASWQGRALPGQPAFFRIITPDTLVVTEAPRLRWRFVSDGAWSDADGRLDTDGAAFIDNVWVWADSNRYGEDFEHDSWPVLAARGWSRPDPIGLADAWHITHDADPPYEGGDGGDPLGCSLDSSFHWRARPEGGYPGAAEWRNGWFWRLTSPAAAIQSSGCVVQYDWYRCQLEYTCDYVDTKVRFYDNRYGLWCPWIDIDGRILYGGCVGWEIDLIEDVTRLYGSEADSMQFAWDMMDVSGPNDYCLGKHKSTDLQIDNVSIGFYDGNATRFTARPSDMLHDSFFDSLPGYNSFFDAYDPDTLSRYAGPPYVPQLPWSKQMVVDVTDKDLVLDVRIYGSIDRGATWVWSSMVERIPFDPDNPALGGTYHGTLIPYDFGHPRWPVGVEVWYYVRCEDYSHDLEYFPYAADPGSPDHTGGRSDYFSFSVMPRYPDDYTGPKLLLVDGAGEAAIRDWGPCLDEIETISSGLEHGVEDIYERVLTDLGYCYDKFDIGGAGTHAHIHCIWLGDYDVVIWFIGPEFIHYLFDKEAQDSIDAYLAGGGKIILAGDRLAYGMVWPCDLPGVGCGEDSMDGRFYSGIMGAEYVGEVESAYQKPYLYLEAVDTVDVFGTPVAVELDSLLLYRGCPGTMREMTYVRANAYPPMGYEPQTLLAVLNPDPQYVTADGAIYTECHDIGQSVFLNFGLPTMVNQETQYCDGSTPDPAADFDPGIYEGRVALLRVILQDIFGLPSGGSGPGGTADVRPEPSFRWALHQNLPNPCTGPTQIRFEVARTSAVSIRVYNTAGQFVHTLIDERKDPGRYAVGWDRTNSWGAPVASGVYFYKLEAVGFSATKKMLVLD